MQQQQNSLFRLPYFLFRKKWGFFAYLWPRPWFHAKTSFCDYSTPDFQSQAQKILVLDWGMNCDSGFVAFYAFWGWQGPRGWGLLNLKSKAWVMNQPWWSMTLSTKCEIDMKFRRVLTPRPLRASSHHWQNLCLVEQSGGKWYYDAKLLLLLVTLQLICWRPIKVAWLHCVTLQASAPAFCLSLFKGQWGRALAALLTQRGCVSDSGNVPFR